MQFRIWATYMIYIEFPRVCLSDSSLLHHLKRLTTKRNKGEESGHIASSLFGPVYQEARTSGGDSRALWLSHQKTSTRALIASSIFYSDDTFTNTQVCRAFAAEDHASSLNFMSVKLQELHDDALTIKQRAF